MTTPGLGKLAAQLPAAHINSPDDVTAERLESMKECGPKKAQDLIKSLAGNHTIILSTHILPEVEQTCEQVIIINKGKLVATDSVRKDLA